MLGDILEFVDRDCTTARKGPSNQIKTRPSSFEFIKNSWRNWRVARIVKKIEKKKKGLLEEQFKGNLSGELTEASKRKIEKNAKIIARLEEKSMRILALEGVPKNYVSSRAIKLREKMYANLVANGADVYSVGFDKYDEVFNSEESEQVDEVAPAVMEIPSPIDSSVDSSLESSVVPPSVATDIVPDVSEAPIVPEPVIPSIETEPVIPSAEPEPVDSPSIPDVTEIKREDIQKAIDTEFDQVSVDSEQVVPVSPEEVQEVVGSSTVSRDKIAEEIANSLSQIGEIADDNIGVSVPEIGADTQDSTDVVEDALNNDVVGGTDSVDAAIEDINSQLDKIKFNGDYSAKVDRFNEDGIDAPKTWDDTPETEIVTDVQPSSDETSRNEWIKLSDEEIAAAQRDLLEHPIVSGVVDDLPNEDVPLNIDFEPQENIREFAVVAPDRIVFAPEEENVAEGSDVAVSTDSDDEQADFDAQIGRSTSIEELEELKRTVEELKKRQKETKEAKARSEERAQSISDQVVRAKDARAKSDVLREEAVAKLRDYRDALLEDCEFNQNRAQLAEEEAQRSEQFIREQEDAMDENNAVINSISSLMGPEAVNVRPKSR